jgi:hypothetical protein
MENATNQQVFGIIGKANAICPLCREIKVTLGRFRRIAGNQKLDQDEEQQVLSSASTVSMHFHSTHTSSPN